LTLRKRFEDGENVERGWERIQLPVEEKREMEGERAQELSLGGILP